MKLLVAIGECMLELSYANNDTFNKSFAGDTYNALVYAKRYSASLKCSLFTAIGDDAISQNMLNHWQQYGISGDKALRLENKTIGVYMISTDRQGERSFSYWRNQSAAKSMLKILSLILYFLVVLV